MSATPAEIPSPPGARSPSGFAKFFSTEAAGAVVLLVVAAIALLLANSPAWQWYESLRHAPIAVGGENGHLQDARCHSGVH